LFGFDVLLDHNLKPWLLEINVLPSFSSSSTLDKRIKTRLICDAMTLVGVPYPDSREMDLRSTTSKPNFFKLTKTDGNEEKSF